MLAFFGGMGLTALVDRLVPPAENPHEVHRVEEMHRRPDAHLMRMGLLSAAAIALHNFPEFDELLPTAREYGEHHVAVYGLTAGMAVMAVSLALLA